MGLVCEAQETLGELLSSAQVTTQGMTFGALVVQTSMTLEMWGEFSRSQMRLKTTSRMQGTQMEQVSKVQVI